VALFHLCCDRLRAADPGSAVTAKRQARRSRFDAVLARAITWAEFLGKFREADRKSLARQLEAYQQSAGSDAVQRWQRFACVLMTLAPYPAKVVSPYGLQFFIPDGLYRRQVYGLQAQRDGTLGVYVTNVLAEAVREGILTKPRQIEGQTVYRIADVDEPLNIEVYDGQTPDPAAIYRAMTGWNRKAMGITLMPSATDRQVRAVEILCALAASGWAGAEAQPQNQKAK